MHHIEFDGKTLETDANGYLLNINDWCPELAPALAKTENIELTDAHWEVVNFVREGGLLARWSVGKGGVRSCII